MAVWDLTPNFSGLMGPGAVPLAMPQAPVMPAPGATLPAAAPMPPAPAAVPPSPMPRPADLAGAPLDLSAAAAGTNSPAAAPTVPMPVPRPDGLGAPAQQSTMDRIGKALSGVKAPEQQKQQQIYSPRAPEPSQRINTISLDPFAQLSIPRNVAGLGSLLRGA